MYTIYKITNKINKKSYIGYTIQDPPTDRWTDHRCAAKRGLVSHFYNAIRKYGPESFVFETLCFGEDHKAGLKISEPLLIEIFTPEYNMTKGGDGHLGVKESEATKRKRSESLMGHVAWNKGVKTGPRSKEINMKRIGVKHSKERCLNMSKSLKGQIPWNKGKRGVQIPWNKGLSTCKT